MVPTPPVLKRARFQSTGSLKFRLIRAVWPALIALRLLLICSSGGRVSTVKLTPTRSMPGWPAL